MRDGSRFLRHYAFLGGTDPRNLENAAAVGDTWLDSLPTPTQQGSPRIVPGLAPLMHLQVRLLQTTDLEQGLVEVERQLRVVFKENRQHSGE
jgi:hypothetical protein